MSCPYLGQVTMSFCAAFPVRKLVPTSRVVTESACEGDFAACPVFRELLARRAEGARQVPVQSHAAATEEGGGS